MCAVHPRERALIPTLLRAKLFWIEELCVGPDQPARMPPEDVAITLLSWVRCNPVTASSTANLVTTRTAPADTGEEELVRAMAASGRWHRFARALPNEPRFQRPVLSAAERQDILAELERIRARVCLRTAGRI